MEHDVEQIVQPFVHHEIREVELVNDLAIAHMLRRESTTNEAVGVHRHQHATLGLQVITHLQPPWIGRLISASTKAMRLSPSRTGCGKVPAAIMRLIDDTDSVVMAAACFIDRS